MEFRGAVAEAAKRLVTEGNAVPRGAGAAFPDLPASVVSYTDVVGD
jgi:hypothetical protein